MIFVYISYCEVCSCVTFVILLNYTEWGGIYYNYYFLVDGITLVIYVTPQISSSLLFIRTQYFCHIRYLQKQTKHQESVHTDSTLELLIWNWKTCQRVNILNKVTVLTELHCTPSTTLFFIYLIFFYKMDKSQQYFQRDKHSFFFFSSPAVFALGKIKHWMVVFF